MTISTRIAHLEENQQQLKAAITHLCAAGTHDYHSRAMEVVAKIRDVESYGEANADLSRHLQLLIQEIGSIIGEIATNPPRMSLFQLVQSENLHGAGLFPPLDVRLRCLENILSEIESMIVESAD